MSGFFGILREDGQPVSERFLQEIAEALRFRGPDGVSVWQEGGMGGCFAKMRTGPVAQAEQMPAGLGGPLRLWGDVRLDGRRELLEQLGQEGVKLREEAASEEYLLTAWRKWGADALGKVIGDFSVAVWDERTRTLWCARDFIGARPFYYANVGPIFCCSNTLDVLRLVPEVSNDLDETYLGDFLLQGWCAEPSRTVYRDIRRLPEGHVLQLAEGRFSVRRFLKLPIEEPLRLKRPEEYVQNYVELLKAAVRDRLPEKATALYLSGGIDSSAVCAIAGQIAGERGQKEKLKAFTVSWEPFVADEEPKFAKRTASHLGIAHEILQEAEMLPFEQTQTGPGGSPEPGLEPFFAREQRQYCRISRHSNVVLSGDGGDDVLTGQAWPYLRYLGRRQEWKELVLSFGGFFLRHGRMPPLRGGFRRRIGRLVKAEKPFEGYPPWLVEDFEERTKLRERWLELEKEEKGDEHPVHPGAYRSLHAGNWSRVLETEDAGWNGVNLETRAPLLDLRVLRYLFRLPPVPWCVDKELCRRAMRDLLPGTVVKRAKTPFPQDTLETLQRQGWRPSLATVGTEELKRFVKWEKWCETLRDPKGSLTWMNLRPLSLLKWLESH